MLQFILFNIFYKLFYTSRFAKGNYNTATSNKSVPLPQSAAIVLECGMPIYGQMQTCTLNGIR